MMSNSSKKNNHCFITIDLDPVYHYVRSPGWNIDQKTINILKDNNYLYDTSILPFIF